MLKRLIWQACVGGLVAYFGAMTACDGDSAHRRVAGPAETAHLSLLKGGSRSDDEEIMGNVTTSDSSGWWAYLSPAGNLPTGATDSVPVSKDHLTGRHWGWFDVGASDGPCHPETTDSSEAHYLDGDPWPSQYETHCVKTGEAFTLRLRRNDTLQLRRDIDWVAWNYVDIGDSALYVDDESGEGDKYLDVIVDLDQTGMNDTVAPGVEVTATRSATEATWDPLSADTLDGKYHIPKNFIVRLGAWPTTAYPTPSFEAYVLVRYFWSYGSASMPTGFVSLMHHTTLGMARTHQYSGSTPYDSTVRAHFVWPDEVPNPLNDSTSTDYGKTLDLNLRIENTFTAVISADPDTVATGDSVTFSDIGGDGGGVDSRFWNFGGGDTVTATTAKRAWASSGTKTVILTKTHEYHGLQYVDTSSVFVAPKLVVGPILGDYEGDPDDHELEGKQNFCSWSVSSEGGHGSKTYTWYEDGDSVGTGLDYAGSVGTTGFELMVIVTDQASQADTTTADIVVSRRGQLCLMK